MREITSDGAGDYHTLITLIVTTEQQTRSISGTLFNDEPRIVAIKGIHMDAKLGPNMLFVTNRDKPGLIGALGTLLGDAGVNIATFNLGRAEAGGDAIALIEIDDPPSQELIDKVCCLEHVIMAKAMRF